MYIIAVFIGVFLVVICIVNLNEKSCWMSLLYLNRE